MRAWLVTFIEAAGLIDPVNDFEIAQNGWPDVSGGGVAVSFAAVKTSIVNDVYWLAGYADGQSGVWALAPHPVGATIFVDDASPPAEDPVAGFGALGFGVPGDAPCPPSIIAGACCFESGGCVLVTGAECAGLCGMWMGEGYSCDPNPCPPLAGSACCLPNGTCVLHWSNVCECLGGVPIPQVFSCDPDPCGGTPVEETTWGRIKARHR